MGQNDAFAIDEILANPAWAGIRYGGAAASGMRKTAPRVARPSPTRDQPTMATRPFVGLRGRFKYADIAAYLKSNRLPPMAPETDPATGQALAPEEPRVVFCPMFLNARRAEYNMYPMFYMFADPPANYMIGAPQRL
jgi:hypothetical protein